MLKKGGRKFLYSHNECNFVSVLLTSEASLSLCIKYSNKDLICGIVCFWFQRNTTSRELGPLSLNILKSRDRYDRVVLADWGNCTLYQIRSETQTRTIRLAKCIHQLPSDNLGLTLQYSVLYSVIIFYPEASCLDKNQTFFRKLSLLISARTLWRVRGIFKNYLPLLSGARPGSRETSTWLMIFHFGNIWLVDIFLWQTVRGTVQWRDKRQK